MWVTKLLIFQVKKRIFCPKTTKFGPKMAFLVNLGQAMQAYSVPCWWVSWWFWCAGCIFQDTYLLYQRRYQICLCLSIYIFSFQVFVREGRVIFQIDRHIQIYKFCKKSFQIIVRGGVGWDWVVRFPDCQK